MKKYIMKIEGTPFETFDDPVWLESYDLEYERGLGLVVLTRDRDKALRFDSLMDLLETWKKPSESCPLRLDGKPNRPITRFSISPEQVEEI